jgi:rod shape-determining protein MreD
MCAALPLVVVLLQVMLVDRLPLPGGIAPDVVLVVVVAIALTHGPITGTVTGFFAGLELDLVPPGGHVIGESAVILCLLGYACGRLGGWLQRSAPRLLAAALIGVGAGEMLQAAAGLIASDPGVTLTAVRQVLPVAVLYDVLICPVILLLAALASRRPAIRQLIARQVRSARPAGMGVSSGNELPARWVRNDFGRLAAIRPTGSRGMLRRRVRVCRQVPRWPRGRSAVPSGRTGGGGGPP